MAHGINIYPNGTQFTPSFYAYMYYMITNDYRAGTIVLQ
jgi:hypothetical protein